ncbi:Rho guanine nucleotide exchange factor [Rhynchospora pubera]|uniref:Rho guanine nucleotide exchange factor n=1 Tax=Rhynchospora pubera TaxID=906938 RepID=A0AAV8C4N8_9POAL|nr:Rho guanine nucleotide exchange factor [Rhynchospora pubera]
MHPLLPLSASHPTMTHMEHGKPRIEFIHTFYSGERELFSRLVSSLEIDGDLALKIISYWLWLEENINKDVIYSIQSLSDDGLKRISLLGEQILINAVKSDSSTAEKALSCVNYFLKTVCCKAMSDLKDRAEYEKAKKALQELDLEEFLCKPDPSLASLHLSSGDGVGSSSSAAGGMHMQLNKGCLPSISKSSLSGVSISQNESYIGGDIREVSGLVQTYNGHFSHGGSTSRDTGKEMILVQLHDSGQNSSQLSALAKAYYPSHASYTSSPGLYPANNVPPASVAQRIDSNSIGWNVPAISAERNTIVPLAPLQSGAIVPQVHIPALAPQSGAVLPRVPALAPQSSVVVPHALVPSQSGTVVSFQNRTNLSQASNATGVLLPAPRLHPDERTLFVTFSNGSPLTADELMEFFVTRYYDDVESIYIEEPTTTRTPQFAHVTFYRPESVELVLAGQAKVKFRTRGKHLWARRFIPRRRRRWGRYAN